MKKDDRGTENFRTSHTDLQELVHKINQENPDPKDIDRLRGYLRKNPDIGRTCGDFAHLAMSKMVEDLQIPSSSKIIFTSFREQLKENLGFSQATELERLLIDQVLITWMWFYNLHFQLTDKMAGKTMSSNAWKVWDKHLSTAQRRYLMACETLARVRKIIRKTPALQVNIAMDGGQQVNVMKIDRPD